MTLIECLMKQLKNLKKIKKIMKKMLDKRLKVWYNNDSEREVIKMIKRLEDKVIHKYGYEHKMTITVFWITHFLRKVIGE